MRKLVDRSLKRTSVNFSLAKVVDDNIDDLAREKGYLNKNHYIMQLLITDNIGDIGKAWLTDLQSTIVKTIPQ